MNPANSFGRNFVGAPIQRVGGFPGPGMMSGPPDMDRDPVGRPIMGPMPPIQGGPPMVGQPPQMIGPPQQQPPPYPVGPPQNIDPRFNQMQGPNAYAQFLQRRGPMYPGMMQQQ